MKNIILSFVFLTSCVSNPGEGLVKNPNFDQHCIKEYVNEPNANMKAKVYLDCVDKLLGVKTTIIMGVKK